MSLKSHYSWLVLEDGSAFRGRCVGADGEAFGEAVFNTSITGYQEVLTDPSYKGQIVCMTYPHIGNYGVNEEDAESRRVWLEGFVVRELSPIASNFRSQESLDSYLKKSGVIAIDGIDTRSLTLKLRECGSMKAGISSTEQDPTALWNRVKASADIVGRDLVKEVTCDQPYEWPLKAGAPVSRFAGSRASDFTGQRANALARQRFFIVVMDFGVKYNILRELAALGCRVLVVPANTSADEIMAQDPDAVVLSNGPGDPSAVTYAISTVRDLISMVPIFGICLGHQILGLAFGGGTFKLKFGHHGGNHPVQDLRTRKVEITTQNHNFAVRLESIPGNHVELTHKNLNDGTVEGLRHKELPISSMQYHPEASPGPHDSRHLFDRFIKSLPT